MSNYETPGVYIEEVATLPNAVAQVDSAVPAFIGYTQNSVAKATRIRSMVEFEALFGGPANRMTVNLDANNKFGGILVHDVQFYLYESLQLYFANGGGPCYIVSAGTYAAANLANTTQLTAALNLIEKEDEPTLLVLTDGNALSAAHYYDLVDTALTQCSSTGDRFTIIDVARGTAGNSSATSDLRGGSGVGANNLKYGAAYYPYLETTLVLSDATVDFIGGTTEFSTRTLAEVREIVQTNGTGAATIAPALPAILNGVDAVRAQNPVILPPSAAMAGIYTKVDQDRGVWKAPANIALESVAEPVVAVNDATQAGLNVDATGGKSINVFREFAGKGTLVWGARTLDGNSNEWRYVPVRRLFLVVQESIQKSTGHFVFEPNDANTWTRLKAMVENYLTTLWREGALAGAKPEQAFFVNVGLGTTMTTDDVLNGRLIVEIGLAAVRPSEFVILRFSHLMQAG
ncbi:MAG: phage tail sheath family protein [Salibacteraceae bacterium]